MPYKVKGKCVYKTTGKKMGCTKGDVQKYLKALQINAENRLTFKQYHDYITEGKPLANTLKPGDKIKNTNPDCEHYGSEGEVEDVEKIPEKGSSKVKNKHNTPGRLVKYRVTNDGDEYQSGDTLYKTSDQLDRKD